LGNDRWARIGASGGIAFVVLLVAGLLAGPGLDPPGFGSSAGQVAIYVAKNVNELQALTALDFAAGFAFLFFLGSVVLAGRAAEGAPGRLAAVAAAGGIAFISIAAIGVTAHATAEYQVQALSGSAQSVAALWDLGNMAFVVMGFAIAALQWSVGLLSVRFGALPRPIGLFSLAAGVYTFIASLFGTFAENGAFSVRDGLLGEIGFFVFLVWVALVSIALVQSPVYARARGGRAR
jgi:hypothetical protein